MGTRADWTLGLIVTTALVTGAAHAGEAHRSGSDRFDAGGRSFKDCTRFNGRFGYYGNPWCDEREQLRWDRWDASRHKRPPGS